MKTTSEKIQDLLNDYSNVHFNQIPESRINEIDWLGYGWPMLDTYGDLIGIGGVDDYPELSHNRHIFVSSRPNSYDAEWIIECDEDTEDEDAIPEGLYKIVDQY